MNRNSPRAKVVNSQHAADNIAAHVIKDQHLPYGVAILVQYGGGVRNEAVRSSIMVGVASGLDIMVQVQNLLNRSYRNSGQHSMKIRRKRKEPVVRNLPT